mgnify:CR=1 FL=1|tara:strand:+ start:3518 stop:3919 length:402 start_codon:yes stop_codon:yes gene_type:complete
MDNVVATISKLAIWFFTIPWIPAPSPQIPEVWGHQTDRWTPIVEEALEIYGLEDQTPRFMRILHCESRGDPNAVNSSSGASGLFQHIPQWWDWRAEEAGFPGYSVFHPIANIYASAWLLALPNIGGWQHWECK